MPNGWEAYTTAMNQFYSAKKDKVVRTNVCTSCAIYGLDGTLWAASEKWTPFTSYDYELEGLDESEKQTIKIDEFKIATMVADGNRTPTAAGIRLCGTKFMMNNSSDGITMMNKQGGGGATIGKTGKALVMGIWDKDALTSEGTNQDAFDISMNVEKVVGFLKAAGF